VLAVVMLVSLTLVGPVLAQDGATVSVDDYEVAVGDVFTVTLEIEDAVDIAAYLVEIGFDPTVVEVQSVTVGDFLGSGLWREVTTFDNTLGTLKVDAALEPPYTGGGVDGDGVLAEIEMEAVGRGVTDLEFTRATVQDGSGTIMDPLLDPGMVTSLVAMEIVPAHPEEAVALGTFTETVMIKGAVDMAGYRFTLRSSDPSVVAIEDVELGPFLEDNSELVASSNAVVAPAEATFQVAGTPPGADPVDGASGSGAIAIVHLNALAVGDAELTLHERKIYDTDAVEEVPDALNGLVHVTDVMLSVVPEETAVFVGQTFDIDIHVNDTEDLASYRFTLAYDPAVVSFVEANDTGFLGGSVLTNLTGPEDGVFTFEGVQAEPPAGGRPDGPGDLATITFMAVGAGTSDLAFMNGEVGIGTFPGLVPAATEDGMVTATVCEPVDITDLIFDSPAKVNDEVEFTAEVTGTAPFGFRWDFDSDGTAEMEGLGLDMVTHTYTETGTYTVTVVAANCSVTDPFTDTMSMPIVVESWELFMPIIAKNYAP
jgi:hypothetical protein